MQEIKLTKQELQKISLDFRDVVARLMRTGYEDGTSNLKRFMKHIDENLVINQFIKQHNCYEFPIESKMNNYPSLNDSIPCNSESEEISFLYQLLKYALIEYDYSTGYLDFADKFCGHKKTIQQTLDNFNRCVVFPFYQYIDRYLTKLQIDIADTENNKINIQIHGMNIDKSTSIQAGRDAVGNISSSEVTGSVTNTVTSQQNTNSDLTDIAQAIAELRQQVSTLAVDRQSVANAAIDEIEEVVTNPTLLEKAKPALWTLWGVAQGVATFANAVTAVAERFGVNFN